MTEIHHSRGRRTGSFIRFFSPPDHAHYRYNWVVVLVICIGTLGCQQQSQEDVLSNSPESEQKLGEAGVLDDGFYSTENAEQENIEEADQNAGNIRLEDNQNRPLQDTIVADSEFSPIEEQPVSEQKDPELFCIELDQSRIRNNGISSEKACERISRRLASVTHAGCAAARLKHTQCESVAGFPILVREFPPIGDRVPQGRILVIGGTHGDELTSVSIIFRWIEKLNKYHSGLFHWHVAPMMNPDGVLNSSATRTNKNGVDLNRNMPSNDWEENALKYWENKQEKNPRRYPGMRPASEPETQWLIDEINTFKPDAIISVHAPFGVVDFDALVLKTAPKNLGKLTLNLLGTYPGSLGNYAGMNRDIPVITLELPHAWDMPSEDESTKIWEDIVSWLRKNIGTDQLADAST